MTVRRFGREVQLATPTQRIPPTQFQIWKYGKINTVKGDFLFDKKAADTVMAKWKSWGNRLTFDYEHKATKEDGRAGDGKSAGSCLLQLRPDGLYATDIRWTPQASTELAAGEWLYFSPTFLSDEKTNRILDLINIALTNIPATKGMTPLVAAARSPRNPMPTKSKKKVALDSGMPKKQPNPAVKNANVPSKRPNPTVKDSESTEGTDEAPAASPSNGPGGDAAKDIDSQLDDMDADAATKAKMGKVKAAKQRLAEAKLEHTLAQQEHDAVCSELSNGDDDGDMDDDGDGEEPDDGIINDEDEDSSDPDEPANHLDQDSDDPDEPANHLDEEDDVDPKDAAPIGPKSAPPGASTKANKTSKVALSASDRAILAVTGETDIRRATGKLYALGLQKGTIAKAARDADFNALAKKYAKPGSLTPKAQQMGRDIFAQMGEESAIGFLSSLSVVVKTDSTKSVPFEGARNTASLTTEELKMCQRLGNDPVKFAEQKRKNAERMSRIKAGEEA